MSEWKITEQQLHEINTFLAEHDDTMSPNLRARTAQESKLFPMLPYFMMSFINAYYRYPTLLRTASEHITPEELGHRARNSSLQLGTLSGLMQMACHLQGRIELIKLGLLRPEDNLEDMWLVVDWYKRFMGAYRRNDGHIFAVGAGDVSHVHDERVLQVLEADAYEVNDELRAATARFMALASQYSFLVFCESRIGLHSSGPYNLGDQRLLHTRDFLNLGESGLPWMDGVAADIPYQNLTLALITDGVRIEVTDFGTPYTTPENYQDRIIGVGLYSSDIFTDRYMPVGMDSREDLIDTLNGLSDIIKKTTTPLYKRFSEMSFDQMTEAGIIAYGYSISDISFMAGTYEQEEWELIDDRVRRLWPIFNEEYGTASFVSDFALLDGTLGSACEYQLHAQSYRQWQPNQGQALPHPGRVAQLVPAHVLTDHDYPRRADPAGGATGTRIDLPRKTSTYTYLHGRLTQDEVNAAAREFSSPLLREPWRNFDDHSVKYGWRDPDVDAMYRYTQERSRLLADRGSGLVRADLDRLRRAAGEHAWSSTDEAAAANR